MSLHQGIDHVESIRMSRKRQIYRELLQFGLPLLRTVRSLRWWESGRRLGLYREAEFIHNLHVSILDPEFGDHDLWFLNHQAKSFLKHADPRYVPLCEHHRGLIRGLFALVPESMGGKLGWPGPDDSLARQAAT